MKNRLTILLTTMLLFGFHSFGAVQVEHVQQFDFQPENAVKINVPFGQSEIIEKDRLDSLNGLVISHVDLVYTAYADASNFNQKRLNEERKRKLLAVLPGLARSYVSWRFVEQTGATSLDQAKKYFHGFVLYIENEHSYEALSTFFEAYESEEQSYEVSASIGGEYTYTSGTILRVPQHAVVHKDGSPVEGNYELTYCEFRNAADIALSGIPMTYNEEGVAYNFSSVGMYELRANADGEELDLAKPIAIDFMTTASPDGVAFYQMDEETETWEKLEEVEFGAEEEDAAVFPIGGVLRGFEDFAWELTCNYGAPYRMVLSKPYYSLFAKALKEDKDMERLIISNNAKKRVITFEREDSLEVVNFVNDAYSQFLWSNIPVTVGKPVPNQINQTLLAEGSANPGHTYPKLVKGLNSRAFGVYNCDQIYRIGKAKMISPKYVDEKGEEIKDKHVVSLIDLNYNGAFSFSPNAVTCNLEGKNVLLLFTKNHHTYMIDSEAFDAAVEDGEWKPTFRMKDVTAAVKSTKDLKRVLNL